MYSVQTVSGYTDLTLAPVMEDLRTNPAMIKPLIFGHSSSLRALSEMLLQVKNTLNICFFQCTKY